MELELMSYYKRRQKDSPLTSERFKSEIMLFEAVSI